jgi:hypothetical protein
VTPRTIIKSLVRRWPALWERYARRRARQQEECYRHWRAHYANSVPAKLGAQVGSANGSALLPRRPAACRVGGVRTFAIVPSWSWHDILVRELKTLGPVVQFDYAKDCSLEQSSCYDSRFFEWRTRSNSELLRVFEEAHAKEAFDWVFAYAQGDHLLASTINTIRSRYRIPAANMCLDDKNSWNAGVLEGQVVGSQGLAAAFDLWWTSARTCIDWINAEGGRAIYLPEGCSPTPTPDKRAYTIPVSFVGGAYGARPRMVSYLRQHGIPVQTFGYDWGPGSAVSPEQMLEIFRSSQINLGHGGIGYSEAITNVKGRDFDIPAAGGGVYLTTFNPDLASHFHIGQEILCWHSYDDLVEQIRYYLARPELCRTMALRAHARCQREHRWVQRYLQVCHMLNVVDANEAEGALTNERK